MANVEDPTPERQRQWDVWVRERPPAVREVLEKGGVKPWKLYRLKSSGHRVTLCSVVEHEGSPPTFIVDVSGRFNLVAFDRRVFGIQPDDLEECDLPPDDAPLGSVLSSDEVREAIEGMDVGEPQMRAILAAVDRSLRGRVSKGDA